MKIRKKIFGLLGLILVAVMTIFAASLPNPSTYATSSVTDTIIVTVVAGTADVNITNPSGGDILSNPNQTIQLNYSDVGPLTVTLQYTDQSGATKTVTLLTDDKNYQVGSVNIPINLLDPEYGYGDYIITAIGEGNTGMPDEDIVSFSFVPVKASVKEDDKGDIFADLEYDDNNTDIDHFEIKVYDKDGNEVPGLSPIRVNREDGKKIEIPFYDYDLEEGDYTVSVTAYDINNVPFYKSYDVIFHYKPIKTPDTGFMSGLNISKSDYLITGLLVFSIVGLVGFSVIFKGRKDSRK